MRLLFIDTIPWDYNVATPTLRPLGGSQSALCYLTVALARRGHEVTLLTNTREPGLVLGVHCVSLSGLPLDLLAVPYDAVVALNGPAGLSQQLAPQLHPSTPLVLWTQHAVDQPAMQELRDPLVRQCWDQIVCVSDWHRATVHQHFQAAAEKLHVLRNAVAPCFENLFASAGELVAAKSQRLVLAYTSTPFRGLDLLISLFPRVREAFPEGQLHIFSSMKVYQAAESQDSYTALYERCRATPGVVYRGSLSQPELAEAMKAAAVLSYPNTFAETSCIAVMEAMAAGAYVVSTELGALPETTLGLAALVSRQRPGTGAGLFASAYLERLRQVLMQRAADPAAFSAARLEQVQQINAQGTWAVRAAQWEQAIPGWKEAKDRATKGDSPIFAETKIGTVPAPTRRMSISQALALGWQHFHANRLAEAQTIARAVLQAAPDEAAAHHLLGRCAFQSDDLAAAQRALREAVRLAPGLRAALDELTTTLWMQGQIDDAESFCRQSLALDPRGGSALVNLGNIHQSHGRQDEAAAAYRQAIAADPARLEAYSNLGVVLQFAGRQEEAVQAFRQALEIRPDFVDAMANMVVSLQGLGRLDEALETAERAIALNPNSATAHSQHGFVLSSVGRTADAEAAYRRTLELRPNYPMPRLNLMKLLRYADRLDESEKVGRAGLAIDPAQAAIHSSLATTLMIQGRVEDALAAHRQACALSPDEPLALSKLLLCEQYAPGVTAARLAEMHARWESRFGAPMRAVWPRLLNQRDPQRRLRIGLLSEDFGCHPVGFLTVRAFENLDPAEVEIICYNDRARHDEMTERFVAVSRHWRETAGKSDSAVAEQIRSDEIDILFDLAAHTSCRMMITARKPAPVQITWLAYPGTTGLDAIDYLIADAREVPEGAEQYYREKVLRLPESYVCFDPPAIAPPVGPLRALQRGYVTFANFSNPAKISPAVVAVWAEILRRVPGSRLRLKFLGFGDPVVQERYRQGFAAAGVDPERLEMFGFGVHAEALAQYNEVDLALDTFPYGSGLTACESLWMGVPVVTFPGETFAGRHALSHLSAAGVTESIARDRADYVQRAVALAADLPRLAELRAGLRARVAGSPLCDGPRFAANLTSALRAVWREWCEKSG